MPTITEEEGSRFGERLRRLREAAGLTQEQLAEKAGLAVTGVAALERGRRQRPYPHTVQALADALGLSAEERAELAGAVPARPNSTPPATPSIGLPSTPTALIGRERELEALGALLRQGARVITLTGPGGVGKTRLAVELTRDLSGMYADGAAFVSLAAVTDADLVIPTIARALDVKEGGGQDLHKMLLAYLHERWMLLMLDNFEQVLDAAPEVAELMSSSKDLHVLVTSRAPLRVQGELEYPVQPLALPDLSRIPEVHDMAGSPAVELFVERARSVSPGFELRRANAAAVAAICRRLDGLPLALELAAARLRAMSPTELLGRLDRSLPLLTGGARDMPERQRTMRAAIEWSYQLLEAHDRRLLDRLSVFRGGWTLEAAQAVGSGEGITEEDVLNPLTDLVEQSLVLAETQEEGATRYRMLVPVREYAEERLMQRGEAEDARRRHAEYFLVMGERAESELVGTQQVAWLETLDWENDNLRAALSWLLQHTGCGNLERTDQALRMAGSLRRFWEARGLFSEGGRWLDAALAASEGQELPARAKALSSAGWMAHWQGEPEQVLSRFEEGAALCRRLGDAEGLMTALDNIASVVLSLDAAARALPFCEESLALARELENPQSLAWSLGTLAAALSILGDYDRAEALLEEGLAITRRLGDKYGIARIFYIMGMLALERRDYRQAKVAMEEALPLFHNLGVYLGMAHALELAATAAAMQAQAGRAVRLWAAADSLREAIGSRRLPLHRRHEPQIDSMRAQLDEESYECARVEGKAMTPEKAVEYAVDEESAAWLD